MFRKEYTPKYECHVLTAAAAGVIGAGLSTAGVMGQTAFNAASSKKQREWSEKMWNAQNAWNLEMWNKTNEYNSPEQQVQRLRDAGLNPLYYGLDGSSANGLEAGQPLGYERAEAPNFGNPAAEGFAIYAQQKSLDKDIELKNAQIDKLKEDTAGVALDNEWKDKTMDARAEAETIKNNISKEQIKNFAKEREKMDNEIKKLIAETDSEIERKALIEMQKALAKAQADEIYALLPYKQLLTEAQTDAQKAAAAASYANAAYQNGLINGGYLDSLIETAKQEAIKAGYDADNAEVSKMLNEYKLSVQNGTVFAINDLKDGKTTKVSRCMDFIAGKLFQAINISATALGAGISGSDLGSVSVGSNSAHGESHSTSQSTATITK